ncbi:LPS O-antigen length regulator [Parashewanella curva]|uniref:LPS O-antigen length regulator n=1 Tax=Parashewanella curva TaxID=2338552 RepID=A0A3L8Q2X9_9GAMM|nr:Wzz/FepE/Etk N-terminal domain-containing protein [Parashewanella curva]RLV61418.1 LPS O-antigen length regulator [Parashewanella curva]
MNQNTPTPQLPTNYISDDEIDLKELFSVIWQGKWLITSITTVFAIGAVIIALMLPNIYKSEALLSPVSDQKGGGLSALAGQFGGLASLAGINLGGSKGDKSQLAIEILKSREFTSKFIQKHQILPELMAVDKWDRATNGLAYDPEVYNEPEKKWLRKVSAPFKSKPSMQEAYKEWQKIFSVNQDKKSNLVTISIEHKSPYIAQQWVKWLVADINLEMKKRDVKEATKSINFLEKQINQTKVADLRSTLFKLIEEQTKTIMFADVRDEYVFATVDPALVPEEKAKPKRALICILGTLLGGMLGVAIVLVRYAFNKKD